NLPVETLGPESRMDAESERAPQAPWSPSKAAAEELAGTLDGEETLFQSESSQSRPILPEETEAKGVLEGDDREMEPPGPGDTEAQGDLEETPEAVALGPDTQDLEDQGPPNSLPSSPQTAWIREEAHCSSSEDDTDMDVEGLRRRRGREPSTPQPVAPLGVEDQTGAEGAGRQLGISLNMCLLGALVLLGLGILLFSGPAQTPLSPFQVVSQRLKVAQKEELQSLMRQPKGLEEENARLRGALQQGEASQRALELELQQLRAQLQGLEADCVRGTDGVCLYGGRGLRAAKVTKEQGPRGQVPSPGFLEQKKQLEAEAQALRQELERQRRLLGSVQQDLEQSLRDAGRGDPAHAGLAEVGHRLAQKLRGLENWGQRPGVPANASEAWHQEPHFQSSREWSGKEKWWDGQRDRKTDHWKHKKEESGREKKKSWGGEEDRELAGRWKEGKPRVEWASKKDGKRQGSKEPPRKSGSPHSSRERQKHPQWKEGAKDRHDPLPLWAELLRHNLEEVAVRQTGDDDEVDDFEDFIFSHFFGDKALKKRSGKKDKHWRNPRVVGPREEHSHQRQG
ncbi:hypothetical protein E2I00_015534, partial [Balaenoptera physalus]